MHTHMHTRTHTHAHAWSLIGKSVTLPITCPSHAVMPAIEFALTILITSNRLFVKEECYNLIG